METQSRKQVFYEDENFLVEYEFYQDTPVLHCQVYHWTPRTARKSFIIFLRLEDFFKEQGYDRMISVSPNPEFCLMYGAKRGESLVHEGKEYEVMQWDLK